MTSAAPASHAQAGRTYEVRTHGCQMNVHDSERLTGLLEDAGYVAAPADGPADVVVFNTCAVRENADNKLYGNLGQLASVKKTHPGMQIAVGGCLAQKDRSVITEKAPWVDVVFGTHNIGSLPVLLERARVQEEAQVEILESLEVFPSTLAHQARVGVRRVGVDLGRLQQHLHVLHRPGAARQGEGPPSRRDPGRDRGPRRRGSHRGHPARPERERLRRRVRRPPGLLQAAPCVRRDRGPRAGAVHLAPPRGVHRRRDRGDGRDPERDAVAAHAAAVRVRPRAQGDAPLLPPVEVPRHHRARPRCHARRRDHDRHHRRLPGRDRGGLRGHPRRRARGTVLRGVHLPVLQAPGHPRRHAARPAPEGRRAGALRAARRGGRRGRLGREPRPRGPHRRADGGRGRGPQGRGDAPALRPCSRQPAGALHARAGRRIAGRRTARRHGRVRRSRTAPRTTSSPTARCSRSVVPGPATPGRPARPHPHLASRSACRPSASPPRSRPRTAAHADERRFPVTR